METSFESATDRIDKLIKELADLAQGLDLIFSAPTRVKTLDDYVLEVEPGWIEKIVSIMPVGDPGLIVRVGDLLRLGQNLTLNGNGVVSVHAGDLVGVRGIYCSDSRPTLDVRVKVSDQGLPYRLPIQAFDMEWTRRINLLARC